MASDLDEFDLIERYFAPLASGEPGSFGLTDDAAELAITPGKRAVITTDAIVSGVHFPSREEPRAIASRLVRTVMRHLREIGSALLTWQLSGVLPVRSSAPQRSEGCRRPQDHRGGEYLRW